MRSPERHYCADKITAILPENACFSQLLAPDFLNETTNFQQAPFKTPIHAALGRDARHWDRIGNLVCIT